MIAKKPFNGRYGPARGWKEQKEKQKKQCKHPKQIEITSFLSADKTTKGRFTICLDCHIIKYSSEPEA